MAAPRSGQFYKHHRSGQVILVLSLAQDVTRPSTRLGVLYVDPTKGRDQIPQFQQLPRFEAMLDNGVRRWHPCTQDGTPLPLEN
jgi:hypothetical protein